MIVVILALILLIFSLIRRIYFQSQLERKAKFNFAPSLGGALILGFLSPLFSFYGKSLLFEMLVASLVILTFISGRNGLTERGVLLPHLLTKLLDFHKVVKVSLKLVEVPQGPDFVMATFFEKSSLKKHALIFEMSVTDLLSLLQKRLPAETQIEAQK